MDPRLRVDAGRIAAARAARAGIARGARVAHRAGDPLGRSSVRPAGARGGAAEHEPLRARRGAARAHGISFGTVAMSEPVRFLTSFAQSVATMALYGPSHPARQRAVDGAYRILR